ncbi:hypothetical protein BH09CHL1_BH09CHL1_35240 [soil metagenome]
MRKMTPSQFRSKMNQAIRKVEQDLNREINRVNRHNKQVVERFVNKYNAQQRAHQQRLQRELQKLNSSSQRSSTIRYYVKYENSVQTLNRSFTRIEQAADSGAWDADAELFDLAERETANSVAVLNALRADESDDQDDPSLRLSTIGDELFQISPDLDARWKGALYALNPQNPDAARHFCTSSREMLSTILETSAPDDAVKRANPAYIKTPNGSVSRRARIKYSLSLIGQDNEEFEEFVNEDIENVISLFDDFNPATHGEAGKYDFVQLRAIKKRVEEAVQFLYSIVSPGLTAD